MRLVRRELGAGELGAEVAGVRVADDSARILGSDRLELGSGNTDRVAVGGGVGKGSYELENCVERMMV